MTTPRGPIERQRSEIVFKKNSIPLSTVPPITLTNPGHIINSNTKIIIYSKPTNVIR